MYDLLFGTAATTELTLSGALTTLGAALLLGLLISGTYMLTYKKGVYNQGFVLTLIMIAPIIAIVILLIGSNVARAFSLAGAFSIIRFRSAPGDPKDITYIFFTLAAGLACGVGLIGYAILFTIILCICMVLLTKFKFGESKKSLMTLRVTIPENLNYTHAFDDIMNQYTATHELCKVKTTSFGSLFELHFKITLKDESKEKEFLDLVRARNGNLDVLLNLAPTTSL